jgi:hypothetical protein
MKKFLSILFDIKYDTNLKKIISLTPQIPDSRVYFYEKGSVDNELS